MAGRIHLWIEISFLEGHSAERDQFDTRNQIINELEFRDFGMFTGAGSGSGTMVFSFRVENEAAARHMLAQVIGEIAPEVNFTVEAVEV